MFTIEEGKLISSQYLLRKIQTIFSVIILPPMGLALGTYLYHDNMRPEEVKLDPLVQYIVLGLLVGVMYWSYQLFFKGMKELHQFHKSNKLTLRQRLVLYYRAVSQQLLWLSVAAWLISIAYLLTFVPYFCYLFLFVVGFASLEWPTKHRIARHLRLKKDERDVIIKQTHIED